tara:strand:+ start:968 stop:2197 length:1230 start_codon:yes stop_codon:yes gene_type:complete
MKKIINFAFYDFANSAFTTIIITFIFSTYFAKQIAPNPILGQSYWGWTIGLTGIAVALVGPYLGNFADKKNLSVTLLRLFTMLCIFFTCILWFAKPSIDYLMLTIIIVALANFFYEISLIFYNSILKNITDNKNLGKSSGFGFGFGYLGGIIILFICIKLFIDTDYPLFGISKENFENIRATSFVVALWYLIFSLPFLFFCKISIDSSYRKNKTLKIKDLVWNNGINNLGKFLIARMLYADGLNAIIVMGGIFAVGVFNLEMKDLLILSVLMNITAFIGSLVGGFLNDKYNSKKIIIFSLIGLILSSAIILSVEKKILFLIFASINGFFIGPIQSASRVFITKNLNSSNQSSGFGLFALSGKLTSFIGPLLVSSITFIFNSQRIGFSSALILLILGLIILLKVKDDIYS